MVPCNKESISLKELNLFSLLSILDKSLEIEEYLYKKSKFLLLFNEKTYENYEFFIHYQYFLFWLFQHLN